MSGNPEITTGGQCSRRGAAHLLRLRAGLCLRRYLPSGPEGRLQTLLTADRGSLVVPVSCSGGMLIQSSCLEEETAERCRLMFSALLVAVPLLALSPQPAWAVLGWVGSLNGRPSGQLRVIAAVQAMGRAWKFRRAGSRTGPLYALWVP
jgi:hypothetical protein